VQQNERDIHGELAALTWEDVDMAVGTVNVWRNLTIIGTFGPPKTDAGIRTIKLLEPALDALKVQREMTARQPRTKIVFHHREYGKTENQRVHFLCPGCEKKSKNLTTL